MKITCRKINKIRENLSKTVAYCIESKYNIHGRKFDLIIKFIKMEARFMSNTTSSNPASLRIANLLDEGSFVEIGGQVTARATDFNMQEKKLRQMASSQVTV